MYTLHLQSTGQPNSIDGYKRITIVETLISSKSVDTFIMNAAGSGFKNHVSVVVLFVKSIRNFT